VTALPAIGFPSISCNNTEIVVGALATGTERELAKTVDVLSATGPAVKETVAVALNWRLSVASATLRVL
jgi:hypothetical protein